SVYSSNLLNNNSGFADSKAQFKLSPGKNALSSQQLELYRKYRHKAQQTYKKLHKLKPNYLTSTGTIYNRLSNEYLISFLELRIYQNEQEAQKELISGLYSDFVITTAKNMLTSCDSNAILFTGGDADTYPLLYVQAFYRHRSDVCIVNLNLLNTDQYTNSFREKTLHAQPLPLSFSPSQLKAPSLQYTLLEDNHYKPSSLSKLIDYVADHGAHQPTQSSYHTNYFEIAHGMDTLRWTIEKPYLNKSEILLLDIINNNQWKRSLHFSALAGKRNYLGLHIYMQNNGLTYTLSVPNNALRNTGAHGYIDSQSLYKKLLSEYSWKGIKNAKDIESVYIPLYRYAFATLCQRLIIENKTKQAREVLNFCEELFPWEKVPVDYTALHFIENHYKLDQIAKGNEVAKTLLQHQQSLLDPEHTDAIRSYLRSFFSIYHQEDMLDLMDGR
ncbi:MAG TPA: hypothetical protein VL947_02820, partial [Cytophagales bacterium]|nr:hypothetical protein [Cytophagales bacterium]